MRLAPDTEKGRRGDAEILRVTLSPRLRVPPHSGLTLVEMLVAIGIVTLLATATIGGVSVAYRESKRVAELAAARNVMSAYYAYANENDGRLLPGIVEDPAAIGHPAALDRGGNRVAGHFAKRWPYRLGPYFQYDYPGVAVVNEALAAYRNGGPMAEYLASVQPSLGLNTTFVGGNYAKHFSEPRVDKDQNLYGNFCVTRLGQAVQPSKLIVFVSAQFKIARGDAPGAPGNFYVLSPFLLKKRWKGDFDPKAVSADFGHVHPRWQGKAVAAQLDGSILLLSEDELQDMRRWSNQAAEADDPNWTLKTLTQR